MSASVMSDTLTSIPSAFVIFVIPMTLRLLREVGLGFLSYFKELEHQDFTVSSMIATVAPGSCTLTASANRVKQHFQRQISTVT